MYTFVKCKYAQIRMRAHKGTHTHTLRSEVVYLPNRSGILCFEDGLLPKNWPWHILNHFDASLIFITWSAVYILILLRHLHLGTPKWSLGLRFSDWKCVSISHFPVPSLFHSPPPSCLHNTSRPYNLRWSVWLDFLYAPVIFSFLHTDVHLTPFLVCLLIRCSRENVIAICLRRVGLPAAHVRCNRTSSSALHLER